MSSYRIKGAGAASFLLSTAMAAAPAQAQDTLDTRVMASNILSVTTYYDPVLQREAITFGGAMSLSSLTYQVDLQVPPAYLDGIGPAFYYPYFGGSQLGFFEGGGYFHGQGSSGGINRPPPIPTPGSATLAAIGGIIMLSCGRKTRQRE